MALDRTFVMVADTSAAAKAHTSAVAKDHTLEAAIRRYRQEYLHRHQEYPDYQAYLAFQGQD
jgi:hypothetical protein